MPLVPLVPLVVGIEVATLGVPLVTGVAEGMIASCREKLWRVDSF